MIITGKKCKNPGCSRRGEILPFDQFYERAGYIGKHEGGIGYLSECIECMTRRGSRKKTSAAMLSFIPSEMMAIDYLNGNNIFACPGKAVGFARVDIAAWGCVRVQLMYSAFNEARGFKFVLTPSQRKSGFRADVVMLICDSGKRQYFYLFSPSDPVFFMPDGRGKAGLTYNPLSKNFEPRNFPGLVVMNDHMMDMAHNRLDLIEHARLSYRERYDALLDSARKM